MGQHIGFFSYPPTSIFGEILNFPDGPKIASFDQNHNHAQDIGCLLLLDQKLVGGGEDLIYTLKIITQTHVNHRCE